MLNRLKRQKQSRRALFMSHARRPLAYLGDLDQSVLRAMRTRAHGPAEVAVMRALGYAGEFGAVWVLTGVTGAALDRRKRLRWLAAAGVAPASIVVNFAVKRTVGRNRPLITDHPPLAKAPTNLSFPSTHSTSSMAAAGALSRVEPRAAVPLHLLAAAICAGRPYLGMHYPSDVIAGAAFGAVLGRLAPLPGDREASPGPETQAAEAASPFPIPTAAPTGGPAALVPTPGENGSQSSSAS
jgi:undecaprenyl-diphosphatase